MPNKWTGRVFSRSSCGVGGPPGEKVILALNPGRRERILEATGWSNVEPGTLNVKVGAGVLDSLLQATPAFREPAETVIYPEGWKHIPRMRKAYLYCKR